MYVVGRARSLRASRPKRVATTATTTKIDPATDSFDSSSTCGSSKSAIHSTQRRSKVGNGTSAHKAYASAPSVAPTESNRTDRSSAACVHQCRNDNDTQDTRRDVQPDDGEHDGRGDGAIRDTGGTACASPSGTLAHSRGASSTTCFKTLLRAYHSLTLSLSLSTEQSCMAFGITEKAVQGSVW